MVNIKFQIIFLQLELRWCHWKLWIHYQRWYRSGSFLLCYVEWRNFCIWWIWRWVPGNLNGVDSLLICFLDFESVWLWIKKNWRSKLWFRFWNMYNVPIPWRANYAVLRFGLPRWLREVTIWFLLFWIYSIILKLWRRCFSQSSEFKKWPLFDYLGKLQWITSCCWGL